MKKLIFSITIWVYLFYNLQAAPNIMPLSEIKPGMKGFGKTVFSGTTVEEFGIEVIDIIQNFSPQLDLILVRLTGSRVEKFGVVSGMSGSPVYIDNKLVGAIAYSIGIFMKEPIAGVTPIEQMFKVNDKEIIRDQELNVIKLADNNLIHAALTSTPDQKLELIKNLAQNISNDQNQYSQLKPIAIPITFSGFNSDVFKIVNPTLEQMGFLVTQGGIDTLSLANTFKPGDAISGVLVSGDYNINATGTVTYCDQNKILAFGHPFFNSGPVNMPMAKAKILTVLPSMWSSNKISAAGKIIGNIRQDRTSGILGVIGEQAPMFPVEIEYISPFDKKKNYHYYIAEDQSINFITPLLFYSTIRNTLESARFSGGDYSLKLNGKFILEGDNDIVLNNFYTSSKFSDPAGGGRDISAAASDIVMTYTPLVMNDFKYPDIEKVELTFQAMPGKKSLRIENIWYDKTELIPGADLNLSIQLQAYQGKLIKINKKIHIPNNITSSRLFITVASAEFITKWEKNIIAEKFQPQNFHELIQLLNNQRKNNILYIQLKVFEKGAFIGGQELPNLPPTILNILTAPKIKGSITNLHEFVLSEYQIPMEYGIFSGKTIQIKINKNKRLLK